jgi:hypothetical protein
MYTINRLRGFVVNRGNYFYVGLGIFGPKALIQKSKLCPALIDMILACEYS